MSVKNYLTLGILDQSKSFPVRVMVMVRVRVNCSDILDFFFIR